MIRLIEPKPRFDYLGAYLRMIDKLIEKYPNGIPCGTSDQMKYAYVSVMAVNSLDDGGDPQNRFQLYMTVKAVLAVLTPEQFVTTFPVKKTYDGDVWQTKDYFTTMEEIRKLPPGQPIGEAIDHLLFDYQNVDISNLMIRGLCALSGLHRKETGREMIQDMFESMGHHLPMYQRVKDPYTGQEFFRAEDGELTPINNRPKLIRILGGI